MTKSLFLSTRLVKNPKREGNHPKTLELYRCSLVCLMISLTFHIFHQPRRQKSWFRHEKLIFFFQIFFPRKISMVTIDSARLYVHPMPMQRWFQRKPSKSPEFVLIMIFSRAASYKHFFLWSGRKCHLTKIPWFSPHFPKSTNFTRL